MPVREHDIGYAQDNIADLHDTISAQTKRLEQLRQGQANLLADPAAFPDLTLSVRYEAAKEAGGDFYDLIRLSDDSYGLLVADVAGHDLGVAYLTGALKALTVSFTSEVLTVDETILMLNAALRKFFMEGQYATVCYVKVERAAQRATVISAGHPASLLQQVSGKTQYIELVGDVLGMFEVVQCESQVVEFQTGDRLFLYTDGLTEGYHDEHGRDGSRPFGARRFLSVAQAGHDRPIADVVNNTVDELIQECGGALSDDVVLLGVQF